MEFDELKKGFWGYRREDVIRYVEEQEAETVKQLERRDAKLAEKDSQLEEKESHLVQLETKYEDRISDLEKELVELRRAQRQREGAGGPGGVGSRHTPSESGAGHVFRQNRGDAAIPAGDAVRHRRQGAGGGAAARLCQGRGACTGPC